MLPSDLERAVQQGVWKTSWSRLTVVLCCLAAVATVSLPLDRAAAEEAPPAAETEPTAEEPENSQEPLLPPVKEVVEALAPPKQVTPEAVPSAGADPAVTPPPPAAETTGSGSTSAAGAAPSHLSPGPTQKSPTPVKAGGGGRQSSGGAETHHASAPAGSPSASDAPSRSHAPAAPGPEALATASEGSSAGTGEAAGTSGHPASSPADKTPGHRAEHRKPVVGLADSRAAEVAPKGPQKPAESTLTTVGNAISHPFRSPTSSSSLLFFLSLILGVAAIAGVFWFELRGQGRAEGPGRRLVERISNARQERSLR